jgi:hypothetical protein
VEKRSRFLSFPYVCPEPVLVKSSFLSIEWLKIRFFNLRLGLWRLLRCWIWSCETAPPLPHGPSLPAQDRPPDAFVVSHAVVLTEDDDPREPLD